MNIHYPLNGSYINIRWQKSKKKKNGKIYDCFLPRSFLACLSGVLIYLFLPLQRDKQNFNQINSFVFHMKEAIPFPLCSSHIYIFTHRHAYKQTCLYSVDIKINMASKLTVLHLNQPSYMSHCWFAVLFSHNFFTLYIF